MADRIAVMYLCRIVEEAETEALFADPQHPYTQLLLQTIPDVAAPNRNRQLMGGEAPVSRLRHGGGAVACHMASSI